MNKQEKERERERERLIEATRYVVVPLHVRTRSPATQLTSFLDL